MADAVIEAREGEEGLALRRQIEAQMNAEAEAKKAEEETAAEETAEAPVAEEEVSEAAEA